MDNMAFSNYYAQPAASAYRLAFLRAETEWGKPLMNCPFSRSACDRDFRECTTVGTTIAIWA